MKIDITGLDKAVVLMLLYNNARNSDETASFCHFFDAGELPPLFTIEDARAVLASSMHVDKIGYVSIHVDFHGDDIDVTGYDRHHAYGGISVSLKTLNKIKASELTGFTSVMTASQVIQQLRAGNNDVATMHGGISVERWYAMCITRQLLYKDSQETTGCCLFKRKVKHLSKSDSDLLEALRDIIFTDASDAEIVSLLQSSVTRAEDAKLKNAFAWLVTSFATPQATSEQRHVTTLSA